MKEIVMAKTQDDWNTRNCNETVIFETKMIGKHKELIAY